MLVFLGDGGASCLRSRVILATFGVHFGDFRIIWGAKVKLKTILRHLMGPMAPQGLPERPRVPFWSILGSF